MFSTLKKFFTRNKKDKFLLVSFLEDKLEIVVLQADFVNKDLEIKNIFEKDLTDDFSSKKLSPQIKWYLRKIFSSVFYPNNFKVIFNFDSNLSVTNFESVIIPRGNPDETLTEADLENLISQAIFNFFGPTRKYASSRLKISEFETLICDVRIYNVLLDKNSVLDLLREKGKKLDFYISETFCYRDFLKELISFLPNRAQAIFIAEGGSVLTHLISRYIKKSFLFIEIGADKTNVFLRTKEGKINYFDSFKWGRNNLYLALAKDLAVSSEVAKSILMRYLEDKTSFLFSKKLNFFLKKELALLNKGLEIIEQKTKVKCLVINLEPSLVKDLKIKNMSAKSLIPIDVKKLLEAFNFNLKAGYSWYKNLYSLAVLLESYFTPQEDLINKLARRRMRWLIP